MKIALVHDYIRDFGGAERVLKVLTQIFPDAPIYTAFHVKDSRAGKEFENKTIIESKFAPFIKHFNLYSPLRFLLPIIWQSIDLSKYDLVITSSSSYIARGFKVSPNTKVICYCHTPPRFLYGYKTGDLNKFWLIKIYANLITPFIKRFDQESAKKVNYWIANSKNVEERIKRIYHKDSVVIYPPVDIKKHPVKESDKKYFLIVSRLVGTKGLTDAIKASVELGFNLKIVGESSGILDVSDKLKKLANKNVEFLGRVSDEKLWELYAGALGFIALARDEDFGMTVVEAQAAGTPVIAFNGGGFKESVVSGKTGILINDTDVKSLKSAIEKFEKIKWNKKEIQKNAKRFSKENFEKEIQEFVREAVNRA
jgi:glycosyltransferase involved in cell wall biosynthesis